MFSCDRDVAITFLSFREFNYYSALMWPILNCETESILSLRARSHLSKWIYLAKPGLNKLLPASKITSYVLVTGTLQIPLRLGRILLDDLRAVSWIMHSYLDIASVSCSVYPRNIVAISATVCSRLLLETLNENGKFSEWPLVMSDSLPRESRCRDLKFAGKRKVVSRSRQCATIENQYIF